MISFRVAESEAIEIQRWADALGIDRSELLRDAVHRHVAALHAQGDAARWAASPPTEAELSLADIADWGPAEDWSDWADAAG